MKSFDELQRIRDRAQETLQVRNEAGDTVLRVGMGTCGIAAGARAVMTALLDELAKRKCQGVKVVQTGCGGSCEQEPIVVVKRGSEEEVTYGRLNETRAREIVASHVVNGQIVRDYVVRISGEEA